MTENDYVGSSVAITKLTPPQIDTLRRALPGLTGAGVLTTTNSIATFATSDTVKIGRHSAGGSIYTPWRVTPESIARVVAAARRKIIRTQNDFSDADVRKLDAVLAKLSDPAAKHLRVA